MLISPSNSHLPLFGFPYNDLILVVFILLLLHGLKPSRLDWICFKDSSEMGEEGISSCKRDSGKEKGGSGSSGFYYTIYCKRLLFCFCTMYIADLCYSFN